MRVKFLAEAECELAEATDRYDAVHASLGIDFRYEVQRVIALILANNRIGKRVYAGRAKNLREFGLDHFPYSVIYCRIAGDIVIVAVSHQHRRSGYWRHRVGEPISIYDIPLAA